MRSRAAPQLGSGAKAIAGAAGDLRELDRGDYPGIALIPARAAIASAVRGRVFALYDLLWATARLASIGLGGLLADIIGITAVYYLGGVCRARIPRLGLTCWSTLGARAHPRHLLVHGSGCSAGWCSWHGMTPRRRRRSWCSGMRSRGRSRARGWTRLTVP